MEAPEPGQPPVVPPVGARPEPAAPPSAARRAPQEWFEHCALLAGCRGRARVFRRQRAATGAGRRAGAGTVTAGRRAPGRDKVRAHGRAVSQRVELMCPRPCALWPGSASRMEALEPGKPPVVPPVGARPEPAAPPPAARCAPHELFGHCTPLAGCRGRARAYRRQGAGAGAGKGRGGTGRRGGAPRA
jgi:hypothetical protein